MELFQYLLLDVSFVRNKNDISLPPYSIKQVQPLGVCIVSKVGIVSVRTYDLSNQISRTQVGLVCTGCRRISASTYAMTWISISVNPSDVGFQDRLVILASSHNSKYDIQLETRVRAQRV